MTKAVLFNVFLSVEILSDYMRHEHFDKLYCLFQHLLKIIHVYFAL